eukprot:CAMPEP_0114536462 /NCGR_PEP_ID=MMETSP0109-20121206/29017_1 /TAXON_ID=29199 /ORGANISM="Chlorarachnion reptans, Strain CCCM449" /LENGTH=425 /DNA_ID=CAMNT_0001720205 /DNA_START=15 /DNA_END=1288 /DNA_ORIENTATION=-
MEGREAADPEMRRYAEKVKPVLANHHLLLVMKPVLANHHLLLVTLLLTNAAAMEALPIFLNFLVPEWLAIVLSVTFVLAFGEVIPQAICTKNPLKIGAQCACVTRCFMVITYPISYPIARLLDCILGEEGHYTFFRRAELKTLIEIHNMNKGGNLLIDEVTIMQGALDLKTKTCEDIMTDFPEVFMISKDRTLDVDTMAEIMTSGHSRVLIVVDPDDHRPISQFIGYHLPIVVTGRTNLLDALNLFQIGRSHMAFVVDTTEERKKLNECMKDRRTPVPPNLQIRGLLTIEDVIEELIKEDIVDETDIAFATREYHEDMKGVRKAVQKFKSLLHRSRERGDSESKHAALLRNMSPAPPNVPRRTSENRNFFRKMVNEARLKVIRRKEEEKVKQESKRNNLGKILEKHAPQKAEEDRMKEIGSAPGR